jgi:hypothetical protein
MNRQTRPIPVEMPNLDREVWLRTPTVEDGDVVSHLEQVPHDVSADEPGSSNHKDPQRNDPRRTGFPC